MCVCVCVPCIRFHIAWVAKRHLQHPKILIVVELVCGSCKGASASETTTFHEEGSPVSVVNISKARGKPFNVQVLTSFSGGSIETIV